MSYRNHIESSLNLVTSYEATRSGFLSIALEKNNKATPFIEQAKGLKSVASELSNPCDLLGMHKIYPALLTASGLSDKSLAYLTAEDKTQAIRNLIKNFLEPSGEDFVDELVFRFLLTKGDTLGGMMRNITGVIGEKKFFRCLISNLAIQGIPFKYKDRFNRWHDGQSSDTTIEESAKGLYWKNDGGYRTLLKNLTVPIVSKNVDLCLFNCSYTNVEIKDSSKYIALGELKGGIDPAGADEHWKTANTALGRINKAFNNANLYPLTFFVGAAIEKKMAVEIYNKLMAGTIHHVANLTKEKQLNALGLWLTTL